MGPEGAKSQQRNWQDIAERASHEQDPQKLMELVSELCEAIDGKPKPIARVEEPKSDVANRTAEPRKSKDGTDSR